MRLTGQTPKSHWSHTSHSFTVTVAPFHMVIVLSPFRRIAPLPPPELLQLLELLTPDFPPFASADLRHSVEVRSAGMQFAGAYRPAVAGKPSKCRPQIAKL
ncbi:MAG: hypothetical protein JO025_21085 [Verrucomicrobia bacterium]|nr:hypothetical protein [Verrucomicrobiota bacterium]